MSQAEARVGLTHISANSSASIQQVLASVRSYLGMDVAFVSEFAGPHKAFRNVDSVGRPSPIAAGEVVEVGAGYCQHVVEGRLPELIPNTTLEPLARSIPETASIPIGAHLSVPIRLDNGRIFGTFCAFSYLPHPELDSRDLELLRTFSQLVARQIESEISAEEARAEKRTRITAAIAAGDPQIVYQPICRLGDGAVTSVEALSRFSSLPVRSPDLWFKEAAEVGLAGELELLAIGKALAGAADLPPQLSLNVNVSPAVIISAPLLDALSAFDPRRLVVEVTEHAVIEDYEALLTALAPVRARGIRVAIDDAGAGYASLRHVLMLKPDIIKFDISITRGVDSDPMRRAMAAALGEFARHTGTDIVAEGVETLAEIETLRSLGIERGQGYYFSPPRAAGTVADQYVSGAA